MPTITEISATPRTNLKVVAGDTSAGLTCVSEEGVWAEDGSDFFLLFLFVGVEVENSISRLFNSISSLVVLASYITIQIYETFDENLKLFYI